MAPKVGLDPRGSMAEVARCDTMAALTSRAPSHPPSGGHAAEPIPGLALSARRGQVCLGLLLLFFLAWDLHAILADQQLGTDASDTTLVDFIHLHFDLQESGAGEWLSRGNVKGPLATLLILGLGQLVGDWLLSARLLNVLLHGVLLLLVGRLTLRLSSSRLVALLAVAICGSFPAEYGWFRLDFHEPMVAVAVVATLLMMMDDLRSPAAAARLGLVVGLGLLTKLTYPMFLLIPGVLYLIRHLRTRRRALLLLLAAGVASLLTAWWFIPSAKLIQQYLVDSTQRNPSTLGHKLDLYLIQLPGSAVLLGAALAGALLAWRGRLAPGRGILALALCVVPSVVLLIFVFDPWSRYIVPAYPAAGVLAALGVAWVLRRARHRFPRVPRLLLCLLVAGLLAQYLWFNLVAGQRMHRDRIQGAGMVAPDTRPYDAYVRATRTIRRQGWRVLALPSFHVALPALWHLRGVRPAELQLSEALADHGQGKPVYVLAARPDSRPVRPRALLDHNPVETAPMVLERFVWLKARLSRMKVVRRFSDPDGVTYFIVRVAP